MIVFLLRHADKLASGDGLTPAGVERAKLLARMLTESGIRFAFRSDAVRAALTLAPLKERLGSQLTIREIPIKQPFGDPEVAEHVNRMVAEVEELPPHSVVAVVGHTNTVPGIIKGLERGTVVDIGDREFDKLFVLFSSPSGKTLLRLRYGAVTPA